MALWPQHSKYVQLWLWVPAFAGTTLEFVGGFQKSGGGAGPDL
jgi:hypothetical protein